MDRLMDGALVFYADLTMSCIGNRVTLVFTSLYFNTHTHTLLHLFSITVKSHVVCRVCVCLGYLQVVWSGWEKGLKKLLFLSLEENRTPVGTLRIEHTHTHTPSCKR